MAQQCRTVGRTKDWDKLLELFAICLPIYKKVIFSLCRIYIAVQIYLYLRGHCFTPTVFLKDAVSCYMPPFPLPCLHSLGIS